MTLAVMGCVVNGPGESKAANIGISLPGTGEAPNCPVFIDGQHVKTLRGTYDELAARFQRLVDEYVRQYAVTMTFEPVQTNLRSRDMRSLTERIYLSGAPRLRGGPCGLVDGVRLVEREGRDFDVEVLAVFGHHLIRSAHDAGRGPRELAAREYWNVSPGASSGCSPTTPGPLTSSVWPVASVIIQWRLSSCTVVVALVGDAHRVDEEPGSRTAATGRARTATRLRRARCS